LLIIAHHVGGDDRPVPVIIEREKQAVKKKSEKSAQNSDQEKIEPKQAR
jgi:hypothetical protein